MSGTAAEPGAVQFVGIVNREQELSLSKAHVQKMAARINSKPATVSKPPAQPNKAHKMKLFVRTVVIALLIAAFLSLLGRQVLSVSCGASGSAQVTTAHAAEATTDATAQQVERILEFEVCNGFTNQRIALLTGLVIAAELQRSVVLPRFLPDGLQNSSTAVSLHETPNVPFKKWFLVAPLEQVLADHGVRITSQVSKQPTLISCKHFSSTNNKLIELLQQHASDPHIRIDCPAFRIPRVALEKHERLFQAAAKALHPTKRYSTLIRERQDHVRALTGSSVYSLLHLRIEQDWFALCKRWTNPAAGRNNCMNNTFNVGEQLLEYGFEQQVPIVVITSFRHVAPKDLRKALVSLELQQYTVLLGKDLVGKELQRDESALVDYYLGRGVDQFIGNSVSTFTAMLMMERQWLKRKSYSYNGGSIPLAKFIPFDPTQHSS